MFYRLRRSDAALLIVIFGLSAAGFLVPALRQGSWHGVNSLGWWLAGVMVLGPVAGFFHMMRD